jgi:uncharacterized protein (TIGR00297 family)
LLLWFIGLIISSSMAMISYHKGSLSRSGALGATFVGTAILGGMGWLGFLVLSFFFLTSSGISKWVKRKRIEGDVVAKGDQRDIYQVLANGGIASILALFYYSNPHPIWIVMFASSLVAATSDTWASELGRLSKEEPRDCFTWKKVERGTSGAISMVGTFASLVGAILTAFVASPLFIEYTQSVFPIRNEGLFFVQGIHNEFSLFIFLVGLSGWLGNWLDTWIGAKWQVLYKCQLCMKHTERQLHCGEMTKQIKGASVLNNDLVNLVCTLGAALISGIVYLLIVQLI